MGRKGITYEQVAAAADALEAERKDSAKLAAIRQRLGTGSPNTIHKHFQVWLANKPKVAVPLISIPDDVARAVTSWALEVSTLGRAEAEERALNAQAAADELAKAGEELENERDQLQDEIASLTTQRDQQQAMAEERSAEIRRLLADVERERSLAGAAQVEAAQARLRADSQVEHLADTRAQVESLSTAIEVERTARTAAEREAAVVAAQLAGTKAELEASRAQVSTLQQELTTSRDRYDARVEQDQALLDELREEHREEINALQAAADSARDAVIAEAGEKFKAQNQLAIEQERSKAAAEKSQDALAAVRAQAAVLEQERAELREHLAAAEGQIKPAAAGVTPT